MSAPGSKPPRAVTRRDRETARNTSVVRRARIAWALRNAPHDRRLVLALLLVEGLSAAEAANALDLPVERVRGSYREAIADLRAAAQGVSRSLAPRRARVSHPRLRKAS